MGKKQANYRKGKLDAGWERVDLLVPGEAVPWLKAYAKALKSAIELGLPVPGFQGMGQTAQLPAAPVVTPSPDVRAILPQIADPPSQAVRAGAMPAAPGTAAARAIAILEREEERSRVEAELKKIRPDFNDGRLNGMRPR